MFQPTLLLLKKYNDSKIKNFQLGCSLLLEAANLIPSGYHISASPLSHLPQNYLPLTLL